MSAATDRAAAALSRGRLAAKLAVPLVAFFLIQNAVSLASLAMIGRLGTAALAGIGIAGAVFGMLIALLYGFDTGVQASVSRATGAGDAKRAGLVLGEALCASAPLGLVLCGIAFGFAPAFVHLLTPDPSVAAPGISWLRGAAPSLLFFSLTIPCNAYWIASGRPIIASLVTLALAPIQVVLTAGFVLGLGGLPVFGAAGAGLALSGTGLIGVAVQLALARQHVEGFRSFAPRAAGVAAIVTLGWPISLQQSFLQLGLVIAYAIVGQLGAAPSAMLNVVASLMLVPIQTATGIGAAAATLVGQALGRSDIREASRWGWQLASAAAIVLLPLGAFAVLEPQTLLSFFIADPQTRVLASVPAQLLGATVAVDAFGRVLNFALRGTGATRSASAIPFVFQWLLQLPLMWWLGVSLGGGFTAIILLQACVTVVETGVLALVWERQNWARVRISGVAMREAAIESRDAARSP
jgi:MATE family multidrug resistance protein